MVFGLVVVHLRYANGPSVGLPEVDIMRLQRIATLAPKLVLGKSRMDSPTQCLKDLPWLPIHLRVEYKVLVTVWKRLSNQAAGYLKSMLQRTKHLSLLVLPSTKKKTFADRSSSVTRPRLWNHLPVKLRDLASLHDFKKQLKIFMFEKF